MRIGLYGGSFDPVHLGHVQLADELRSAAELDRVVFLPARQSPHKASGPRASDHHRLTMLGLALSGRRDFTIDARELDRPAPSYTVDTVREISREHPGDELFFLLGLDSLEALPRWHRIEELAGMVRFLVATRPDSAEPEGTWPETIRCDLIETRPHPAASSLIRAKIRRGESTRGELDESIRAYIDERALYRAEG